MNHQLLGINLIVAATMGGIAILHLVILWFMPRLTRPDLYFAVTVPSGFRDAPSGKSILRRYRTQLVLISLLALLIFAAGVVWVGVRFVSLGLVIQVWPDSPPFTWLGNAPCRTRCRPPRSARRNYESMSGLFLAAGSQPWDRSFCWLSAPPIFGFMGQNRSQNPVQRYICSPCPGS